MQPARLKNKHRRILKMAEVTRNEDGSVDLLVHIEPEKMAPLLFKHVDFDALVANIEDPAVAEAAQEELKAAEAQYQEDYKAGLVNGSIFLDKPALVAWYRQHGSYETAAEKEARLAQEAADKKAALEAAKKAAKDAESAITG
jgi:hypothetical protein